MRILLPLALAAALAPPVLAATLQEIEQEALRRRGQRDELARERRRLAAEAGPLAEAIARSGATGPRAGPELTKKLRALDRVAARLDGLERRLRAAERGLERAAAAFQEQLEVEERALLERARRDGASSTASELAALADARRRMAALSEPSRFRRPLEVSLGPLDGPLEIEAKLQMIDGERARLAERERELRQEQSLLAARLRSRREWARDLGVARRDAAGEIELLERAHEAAEEVLRELSARTADVAEELARVRQWDEDLALRRREAAERLRALETRQATP